MARRSSAQVDDERMMAATPCKIGTMPNLVTVHGKDRVEEGRLVRVKEWRRGSKWMTVKIDEVQPSGYFKASLA